MPEEERAAGAEQETFKLRSCKHKNCKYRATATMAKGVYNCDYALMTGHTRAAQPPRTNVSLRTACCTSRAPARNRGVNPLYRQDEHQEQECVPAVHKPLPRSLPEIRHQALPADPRSRQQQLRVLRTRGSTVQFHTPVRDPASAAAQRSSAQPRHAGTVPGRLEGTDIWKQQ